MKMTKLRQNVEGLSSIELDKFLGYWWFIQPLKFFCRKPVKRADDNYDSENDEESNDDSNDDDSDSDASEEENEKFVLNFGLFRFALVGENFNDIFLLAGNRVIENDSPKCLKDDTIKGLKNLQYAE